MLSAKRDPKAAKRFLIKVLNGGHTDTPRVINVDKNAVITSGTERTSRSRSIAGTDGVKTGQVLEQLD